MLPERRFWVKIPLPTINLDSRYRQLRQAPTFTRPSTLFATPFHGCHHGTLTIHHAPSSLDNQPNPSVSHLATGKTLTTRLEQKEQDLIQAALPPHARPDSRGMRRSCRTVTPNSTATSMQLSRQIGLPYVPPPPKQSPPLRFGPLANRHNFEGAPRLVLRPSAEIICIGGRKGSDMSPREPVPASGGASLPPSSDSLHGGDSRRGTFAVKSYCVLLGCHGQ